MGAGDDQDGYGFARRGMPSRKKIGRRTAAPAGPPPSARSRAPHPYVQADDYAPHGRKPAWVWLLIGFLLGTGGTLMTASFWFPEGGNREFAAIETGADGRTLAEPAVTAGGQKSPEAVNAPDRPTAGGDSVSPQTSTTNVASAETAAATADSGRPSNGSATTGTAAPDPVVPDAGLPDPATPDLATRSETPEPETKSEQLLPPISVDAAAEIERQPAAADPPRPPLDPQAAPAALVEKGASAPTPSPPPDRERSTAETGLAAVPTAVDKPSPASPAEPATAALDDPERLVNEPVRTATTPAATESATPAETVERPELPPRIRQALLKAGTGSSAAGNGQRLYRVQLAAVDNEAAARIYWREVNARLPGVFDNVEPIYNQRVVDERPYLRIWVGAFDNRGDALGYCGWLKQQGQDCFVTRVDNL
ncbi:MAG: SPOR domain-containing protein [Geminicoccaceae bacterium]